MTIFSMRKYIVYLLSGKPSDSQYHTFNSYLFIRDFMSHKELCRSEMSPLKASLAEVYSQISSNAHMA